MTGAELIKWIQEHHAEKYTMLIWTDEGWETARGIDPMPCRAKARGEGEEDLYDINFYLFEPRNNNAIVL